MRVVAAPDVSHTYSTTRSGRVAPAAPYRPASTDGEIARSVLAGAARGGSDTRRNIYFNCKTVLSGNSDHADRQSWQLRSR